MTPERQERIADIAQALYVMRIHQVIWAIFAVVLFTCAALLWTSRFEYIRHAGGTYTKVNRWTGEAVYCGGQKCFPVNPHTQPD